MLHPHLPYGVKPVFTPVIAAEDQIGLVPDLPPIIHDFEHSRARNQQRHPKKRPEPPPSSPKTPDPEHRVDEYA